MANDTIVSFTDPAFRDELSDLVREGAGRSITHAVEAELQALKAHDDARDTLGGERWFARTTSLAAAGIDRRWPGDGAMAVRALHLLILTGSRRNEILTLRWDDVDFGARELRLRDSKTGPCMSR